MYTSSLGIGGNRGGARLSRSWPQETRRARWRGFVRGVDKGCHGRPPWRRHVAMFAALRGSLARPAAALAAATGASCAANWVSCEKRGVTGEVHAELNKLRPNEQAMRRRWEEDELGWHKLPPRAWPPRHPKYDELEALQKRLADERCGRPTDPGLSASCQQATFDLATCYAFNMIDPPAGLAIYEALASKGDTESMVGVGVILLEGIGCDLNDANTSEGLRMIRGAAAVGNVQGQYELAVLHYLGRDIEEDEHEAFRLFELACVALSNLARRPVCGGTSAPEPLEMTRVHLLVPTIAGRSSSTRRLCSCLPSASWRATAARKTWRERCPCCTPPPSEVTGWHDNTSASGSTRTPRQHRKREAGSACSVSKNEVNGDETTRTAPATREQRFVAIR